MMQYSSQNSIVDALDGMKFKGNIIPAAWYKTVLTPKGKPDSIAIIYVMESLSDVSSQVRNIRAVMVTAMYNAPATMDSYYTAKENHDMKTA